MIRNLTKMGIRVVVKTAHKYMVDELELKRKAMEKMTETTDSQLRVK